MNWQKLYDNKFNVGDIITSHNTGNEYKIYAVSDSGKKVKVRDTTSGFTYTGWHKVTMFKKVIK